MSDIKKKLFYKNIELLNYSEKVITNLRIQNYNSANKYITRTINLLIELMGILESNRTYFNGDDIILDSAMINKMLMEILNAQEVMDYVLLSDLFEDQLNSYLLYIQQFIMEKEPEISDESMFYNNLELITKQDRQLAKLLEYRHTRKEAEDGYIIEATDSGLNTLAAFDQNKKYYFHSRRHIFREAGTLAREWFSYDKTSYILYGLGFGYHINKLLDMDETIHIKIFESSLDIIYYACRYADLTKILTENRVQLIYDPELVKLCSAINHMEDQSEFLIHYPSLRNIANTEMRFLLEDYFISYSSINNQLSKLNNNFNINIVRRDEPIDNLREIFRGKDLFIIAAGPSLDKNISELKHVGKNSIILSTGTVFKKLLKEEIIPDYVIIIDANDSVFQQIEGIKCNTVPLLYLSTVYYKVPEFYQGIKYLICQRDFTKSEEYAANNILNLFQTGGSVSTTAIDIGISFECKRIICVGLDLAYTNNRDHASGTASVNRINRVDIRQVKDIYGNMIPTGKNLDIYRKWIEKRIDGIDNIELLNATEGGAFIKGMKHVHLKDIIKGNDF